MIRGRALPIVAPLAAFIVLGPQALAGVSGPVRVSAPSPYLGCTTAPAGGTVYPNAEVEPSVTSNPSSPTNLIGTWQQDRWSNGGAHGLVAGWSADGGRTWGETPLPFSVCAPGGLSYARASDPIVSIGPDGTAYASSLSFTPDLVAPSFTKRDAIAVATSTDGGRSWANVRVVDKDTNGDVQGFLDKEWVTADPSRPGVAYVAWDHWTQLSGGRFAIPSRFSMTTDGGRHWTAPVDAVPARANEFAGLDQVFADPVHHLLYLFFVHQVGSQTPQLSFVSSRDQGKTWSAIHVVNRMAGGVVVDPVTHQYLRTGDGLFSLAFNPATGRISIAWQDSRFTGGRFAQCVYTSSADGGRNWTALRIVNTRQGVPAFLPTIAFNSVGDIGLLYYDFRQDNPNTLQLTTNVWFRVLHANGVPITTDRHLAGPFNFDAAPNAGGRFVGDYEAMTAIGEEFVPFFVTTNCLGSCSANRTDVYAATVTSSTGSG